MAESSASDFPELPKIIGDIILETFSHKSLRSAYNPEESFDNERLAELGRTVLQLAVTDYLYQKRPIVPASQIPALRDHILCSDNYDKWVSHYNLRQRLRYSHSDTLDILADGETKALFQAYVGAVFTQSGPHVAINWILRLVDPDGEFVPTRAPEQADDGQRASKRLRGEPLSPKASPPPIPAGTPLAPTSIPTSGHNVGGPSTSIYSAAPVPAIGSQETPTAMPNNIASAAAPKSPAFLSLFNQRCSQQHLQLEYVAENHGASHAPIWVIKCFVNGIQKGQGRGTTKQIAKEAAAKEAYYGMGWAGYGPQYAGKIG